MGCLSMVVHPLEHEFLFFFLCVCLQLLELIYIYIYIHVLTCQYNTIRYNSTSVCVVRGLFCLVSATVLMPMVPVREINFVCLFSLCFRFVRIHAAALV